MSVCDAFTEHAWKKGKCKNCFKSLSQHKCEPTGGQSKNVEETTKVTSSLSFQEKPRPPVAKKPALLSKSSFTLFTPRPETTSKNVTRKNHNNGRSDCMSHNINHEGSVMSQSNKTRFLLPEETRPRPTASGSSNHLACLSINGSSSNNNNVAVYSSTTAHGHSKKEVSKDLQQRSLLEVFSDKCGDTSNAHTGVEKVNCIPSLHNLASSSEDLSLTSPPSTDSGTVELNHQAGNALPGPVLNSQGNSSISSEDSIPIEIDGTDASSCPVMRGQSIEMSQIFTSSPAVIIDSVRRSADAKSSSNYEAWSSGSFSKLGNNIHTKGQPLVEKVSKTVYCKVPAGCTACFNKVSTTPISTHCHSSTDPHLKSPVTDVSHVEFLLHIPTTQSPATYAGRKPRATGFENQESLEKNNNVSGTLSKQYILNEVSISLGSNLDITTGIADIRSTASVCRPEGLNHVSTEPSIHTTNTKACDEASHNTLDVLKPPVADTGALLSSRNDPIARDQKEESKFVPISCNGGQVDMTPPLVIQTNTRGDANTAFAQLISSIKPPAISPELPAKQFKRVFLGSTEEEEIQKTTVPNYSRPYFDDQVGHMDAHCAEGFLKNPSCGQVRPQLKRQGATRSSLTVTQLPTKPPRPIPENQVVLNHTFLTNTASQPETSQGSLPISQRCNFEYEKEKVDYSLEISQDYSTVHEKESHATWHQRVPYQEEMNMFSKDTASERNTGKHEDGEVHIPLTMPFQPSDEQNDYDSSHVNHKHGEAYTYKQDYPKFINFGLDCSSNARQRPTRASSPGLRARKQLGGGERNVCAENKSTGDEGMKRKLTEVVQPTAAECRKQAQGKSFLENSTLVLVIPPGSVAAKGMVKKNAHLGTRPDHRIMDSSTPHEYTSTAIYGNMGMGRVDMTPEKHPRHPRGVSEESIVFEGPESPKHASDDFETPPPLPSKRSKTLLPATKKELRNSQGSPAMPFNSQKEMRKTKSEETTLVTTPLMPHHIQCNTDPLGKRQTREKKGQLYKCRSVEYSPTHPQKTRLSDDCLYTSVKQTSVNSCNVSSDSSEAILDAQCDCTMASRCNNHSLISGQARNDNDTSALPGAPKLGLVGYRDLEDDVACSKRILDLQAKSILRLEGRCRKLFEHGCSKHLSIGTEDWPDFKLDSRKPCCFAGDGVYYLCSYAKDPDQPYAVKVCKGQAEDPSLCLTPIPEIPFHYNLQHECGRFVANVPQSLLPPEDKVTGKGAAMEAPPFAEGQRQESRLVMITQDKPCMTMADFVKSSREKHRAEPEDYELKICFLLLQLCQALESLKTARISHCDICLNNLLLESEEPLSPGCSFKLPRLILSNFSQAKGPTQNNGQLGRHSHVLKGIPASQQDRLAPEILSASQYGKLDEFQTGILIYEMLHLPNPFEVDKSLRELGYSVEDLPPFLQLSLYSHGLQQLARALLHPVQNERLPIASARNAVQFLIWGPKVNKQPKCEAESQQSWLEERRALVILAFAEKALPQEKTDKMQGTNPVVLEEWLRCQYFASATVDFMKNAEKILQ
uniref:inactive tyrosine-protein kinase PEAK1-like n=1 Tax=Myxine glutinosa TaxID=7769 RepID=UPI00358FAD26